MAKKAKVHAVKYDLGIVEKRRRTIHKMEDIKRGKIPSNQDILSYIEGIKRSIGPKISSKMSLEGNQFMQDLITWFDLVEKMIAEKNDDELFQKFVYHARLAIRMSRMEKRKRGRFKVSFPKQHRVILIGDPNGQSEKMLQIRSNMKKKIRSFYKLINVMFTSSEFRKVFADLIEWFQDCFKSQTIPVSTKVEPAPIRKVREEPFEVLKKEVHETEHDLSELELGHIPQKREYKPHSLEPISELSEFEKVKKLPVVEMHDPVTTKTATTSTTLVERLREILKTIFKRRKYVNALEGAVKLFSDEPKELFEAMPPEWYYDANISEARNDLMQILQRLANNVDLKPMFNSAEVLLQNLITDYELKDFITDSSNFVSKCKDEFIDSAEFGHQAEFLIKRLQDLHHDKYGKIFNSIASGAEDFSKGLESDKLTKEFGELSRKLIRKDFFGMPELDEKLELRWPVVSANVFKDLRYYALPAILRSWRFLPLPRIEVDNSMYNFVFNDVVLDLDDFIPACIDVDTAQHIHTNPKSKWIGRQPLAKDSWKYATKLKISNLNFEVTAVKFDFVKKKGFMKFKDSGLVDFKVGGKGLEVFVNLKTDDTLFHADSIKAKVHKLKFRVYNAKHAKRWKMMSPFINSSIKKQMERSIVAKIDELVKEASKRAQKAKILANRSLNEASV